jgi:hypothetical protein
MSRAPFQKSVRMFHKFSEETMRRRGGNEAGREGVVALAAIEATLRAERLFDGSLLEPLAAFTNLLQSGQLPPEFGDFSLGDGLLAIEEAHSELRQSAEQRWEFEPELSADAAAAWRAFTPERLPLPANTEHERKLRRFVLEAAQQAGSGSGSALVVGASHAPELPWAELAAHFGQLTLSDLDLQPLEELVRRAIPEEHRSRIKLERYDLTGSYAAFAAQVSRTVQQAATAEDAERELVSLLQSYDVSSGSAGLRSGEAKPELAISALVLPLLGAGYGPCIAAALTARGFDPSLTTRPPLQLALGWLRCLVEQHHVQALLRRAQSAALISPVSEVVLRRVGQQSEAEGEPLDLLSVERLVERLPESAPVKAEQSWELAQDRPQDPQKRSLLTLIEAVLV